MLNMFHKMVFYYWVTLPDFHSFRCLCHLLSMSAVIEFSRMSKMTSNLQEKTCLHIGITNDTKSKNNNSFSIQLVNTIIHGFWKNCTLGSEQNIWYHYIFRIFSRFSSNLKLKALSELCNCIKI